MRTPATNLYAGSVAGFSEAGEAPQRTAHAPVASESHRVDELLATFPDADVQSVLVVASRAAVSLPVQPITRCSNPLEKYRRAGRVSPLSA